MNEHYPFQNPPLPYAYNALEPYIDEKTMHLHHDKHLQTYVDNLNLALKPYPALQNRSLIQLLSRPDALPEHLKTPIKNNAGGVYNHIFYFFNLNNEGNKQLPEPLLGKMNASFGSFENFKDEFTKAALSVFGSGYAWLVLDKSGSLSIVITKNQDTPISSGLCPVLNIDVWEHAYYLKHYNVRADYIKDWFSVVDWNQANRNLINCMTP